MNPTCCLPGCEAPFSNPTSFLISTDVGGVLSLNVKLLSSKIGISTGMTVQTLSEVLLLYSLQNAIIFTPFAPSAGPTGGAGLAFPASRASLIIPATFPAIQIIFLLFEMQVKSRVFTFFYAVVRV